MAKKNGTGQPENGQTHNYGIDLLRLLAFAYVIVLHTIGHGGIIGSSVFGSRQYMLAAGLEIWTYCAVALFGLISGYVGYRDQPEKPWKKRALSYLGLWLQVVFFAVVPSLIQYFLLPGSLSLRAVLEGFFPVTTGQYWYFTAYTGLFLLMPVLNAALRLLDAAYLKRFLIIWLLAFSLYASPMERFSLGGGYSTFYLVLLYLAGGAVRKLQAAGPAGSLPGREPLTGKTRLLLFGGIAACALLSWIWLLCDVHFVVFGIEVKRTTWMNYTSFTVCLAALLHLLWFSGIRVPARARRFVRTAASCGFGIYLLNTQPALWELTKDRYAGLGSGRLFSILLTILLNLVVFMAGGIIIDYARQRLFSLFRPPASAREASSR